MLQFDDEIKDEMKDIIKNKYGGIDDFTAASLSMSYVMLNVSTYTALYWSRHLKFKTHP